MTALALITMTYSEKLYRQDVNREIFGSLASIAAALDRRLLIERDLIQGLSNVPAVRAYIPVMEQIERGNITSSYSERLARINRFLEIFQSVRLSLHTVRVLDTLGNTLVKVQSGARAQETLDAFGNIPIVEEKSSDEQLQRALLRVPRTGVGAIPLPADYDESGFPSLAPVMNAIVPLEEKGSVVGYFTVDPPLGPLNRILDVAPRVFNGELFVAEVNPAVPDRDGLILYDDHLGVSLVEGREHFQTLYDLHPGISDRVFVDPTGFLNGIDGLTRIYYQELLPYSDRLVSWIIGIRVDMSHMEAPFLKRQTVILTSLAVALLVSLLLAQVGAAQIATPVSKLAQSLAAYTHGEKVQNFRVNGPLEIHQAGEAFSRMVDKLEKAEKERSEAELAMLQSAKLASIGQMAAGIGHEINNPLGNILSLTKLIERSLPESDETLKKDVAAITEEVQRVSRIVKAILDFARQVPPHIARFRVESWLKETLEFVGSEARKQNVTLRTDIKGSPFLEGDRDLLQQAAMNLILNAIQASPAGGTVCVTTRTQGNEFIFTVEDHGKGISQETFANVFDPFFTTKPEGEGSGLGLSISLGIIERHGGTLELLNGSDGGVIATVRLINVTKSETDKRQV